MNSHERHFATSIRNFLFPSGYPFSTPVERRLGLGKAMIKNNLCITIAYFKELSDSPSVLSAKTYHHVCSRTGPKDNVKKMIRYLSLSQPIFVAVRKGFLFWDRLLLPVTGDLSPSPSQSISRFRFRISYQPSQTQAQTPSNKL